jgi:L-aspartate oxidase
MSVPGTPRFLLSEALRGEGARLVNHVGDRFMQRYEPAGDLASRDLVSRAIVREMERTHEPVYLSLAHMDRAFVHERFPTIAQACASAGFDLASDRIPVSPAAHYVMGGVETDLDGRTSLDQLFAAGEVACTGLHGANRLASNSLLEGLVSGARAGKAMREEANSNSARTQPANDQRPMTNDSRYDRGPKAADSSDDRRPKAEDLITSIRDLMWNNVGVVRSGHSLQEAIAELGNLQAELSSVCDRRSCEARNLHTIALLIARCALARLESRGAHYRTDFPNHDDNHFKKHSVVKAEKISFE